MATGILLNSKIGWVSAPFWLVVIFLAITQSELKCPACRANILSQDLGSFCPECGASNIKPGGWFSPPRCTSCGKSLGRGKTRGCYRVRACTHCGLMLDVKGF